MGLWALEMWGTHTLNFCDSHQHSLCGEADRIDTLDGLDECDGLTDRDCTHTNNQSRETSLHRSAHFPTAASPSSHDAAHFRPENIRIPELVQGATRHHLSR